MANRYHFFVGAGELLNGATNGSTVTCFDVSGLLSVWGSVIDPRDSRSGSNAEPQATTISVSTKEALLMSLQRVAMMDHWIKVSLFCLGLLLVVDHERLVMAGPLPTPATRPPAEILVIDLAGFRSKGSGHAEGFRDTILPGVQLLSIGIHGIVPDAWRGSAGYDAIVRAGSRKDYAASAHRVYDLVGGNQTVVAFDINEDALPNQLRAWPKSNKVYHPALVAARTAELWRRDHPNGTIIVRGHSDGTYGARYIVDYFHRNGLHLDVVVIESPRESYFVWRKRARSNPGTKFLSITATNDLPRATVVDRGFGAVPTSNWINFDVRGLRNPLSAHAVVTDYQDGTLVVQRSDVHGKTRINGTSLASLIRRELGTLGSPSAHPQSVAKPQKRRRDEMAGPSQRPPLGLPPPPPPPPSPPPPGGSLRAAGAGSPLPVGERGGIAANVVVRPEDFRSE